MLTWLLFSLLERPASAGVGLVGQIVIDGDPVAEPILVTMLADGQETVLELRDNGQSPDVQTDDGRYSGSGVVEGDSFDLSVTIEGEEHKVGPVAWPDDGKPRDLIITRYGELFTVETEGMGPPAGVDAAPPAGSPATVPGSSGDQPPAAPATTSTSSAPASSGPALSRDTTLQLVVGVGLLALVGVVGLWWRGRDRDRPGALPPELVAEPTPGLGGTPGLQLRPGVRVAEADPEALLVELGRTHRVLLAAPTTRDLPRVHGGPVYRTHNLRPAHVADAAEALLHGAGRPLAVLVVGRLGDQALEALREELPKEIGCLVVPADG